MAPVKHGRLAHVLFSLLGFFAAEAYAGHEQGPDASFKIPRAELISTIKTVGMMPITVAAEVPDVDGVSARYEAELVERFTAAGFSVVPPSGMREIRERIQTTLGGIYDPVTGHPIKERVEALSERSHDEYLASHKVDALLQPAIVLRSAEFDAGKARWDGVTDSSSGRSGMAHFMTSLMMGGADVYGQVPALSFVVDLTDPGGKLLYTGAGGLQVLGYARAGAQGLLATVRLSDVDAKFIMTDPARDARALSLALDPLLHGSAPAAVKIASMPVSSPGAAGGALTVSREELIARFPRLALAPLGLMQIAQRDQVRLRYREALAQKLRELGFEVSGGDDYGRLWDAECAAAGGYFDPFSGRLNEAKLKASRLQVFKSMQAHEAATAVVLPTVVFRAARYRSGTAEWDGATESLTPGKSRFGALFDRSMNYGGELQALSLVVRIIDPAGELVFEGSGGIQLTERFPGGGQRPLAESELFSDPGKDTRAIDIAVADLAPPAATHH